MRTRAYALYSMALTGLGNLGETQFMAERIHELDTFSQAALALALYKLGDIDGALAIIPILAETALQRDNLVYWPQPREDGHYYEKTMASTTRSTAIALDAFVQIAPDHAFIPGIVQYLMRERKTYGWGSTNETAFAIIALTDHLLSLASTTTETGFVIELNENEILSGSLGPGVPLSKQIIPYDLIDPGANLLSITTDQDTQLYYTIISRVFLPQEQIEASGNIQITREYIDLTTKKPAEAVIVGDLVKIKLTITIPDGASFIIVEDLLPGGYEALNESLNTTSHEGVSKECAEYEYYESCWPHYYWEDYGYNNKDVHGDRVTFFITEFNAGTLTLSYLARATHSGIFIAMPAEVYAMYDATLWGRSDSTMIEVSR